METLPQVRLRVLTHGVRYATSSAFKVEVPREQRKQSLLNELRYHKRRPSVALICLQEVLHQQRVDILKGLNEVP
ncbi:hypothetical protein N7539_003550 [Penicillium diatomitis]|uniref:Uncharacterized protein n=1 Tax=Penicillium diatomitis TaxID=2819901 RepID=A0A9W9XC53_9EURO|nr:uncharacterized protein N7539_003550 [Penicillium diatomitis]KAJ5488660.1 hypothetical protein N7539_003550 [Penicillium diatomitis]